MVYARFGQGGDEVCHITDHFDQGQGQELDNFRFGPMLYNISVERVSIYFHLGIIIWTLFYISLDLNI